MSYNWVERLDHHCLLIHRNKSEDSKLSGEKTEINTFNYKINLLCYLSAMQPNRVQRKIPLHHTYAQQTDTHPSESIKFRCWSSWSDLFSFRPDRCPHNRFGNHCEYSCSQCIFGTCNWRLKKCHCHAGYSGTFCNQTSSVTRYRFDQTHRCQLCHKGNTASCHMEVRWLLLLCSFKQKMKTNVITSRFENGYLMHFYVII